MTEWIPVILSVLTLVALFLKSNSDSERHKEFTESIDKRIEENRVKENAALQTQLVDALVVGLGKLDDRIKTNNTLTGNIPEAFVTATDRLISAFNSGNESQRQTIAEFRDRTLADIAQVPDLMWGKIDPAIIALNGDLSALAQSIGELRTELRETDKEQANKLLIISTSQDGITRTQQMLMESGKESSENLHNVHLKVDSIHEMVLTMLDGVSRAANQSTPPMGVAIIADEPPTSERA